MKPALLMLATLYAVVSCAGKSNLEEQIAANGVFDKTSKVEDAWLKVSPKDSVKIQSQKSLRIPIKETIWNQTTGTWQDVNFDIRGLLKLYVLTKEDDTIWSSCGLDTYLSTDSLTASALFLQGNAMSGARDIKDHTTMRLAITALKLTESPHAPELMKLCEASLNEENIKTVRKNYNSLLVTSWLETISQACQRTSDCEAWSHRFPKNWGKGEVSCRKGFEDSKKHCGIIAPSGASCPVYLTNRGLMGHPVDEASVLLTSANRSSLICSKPGFMCLITGQKPSGLFESSCRPEIEKYFSQTN